MKKTLFIAFLLIPFLGISQTTKPIEGFLGIKFGSSKAAVIAAIKAKGGHLAEGSKITDDELYFEEVNLGHRTSQPLSVHFVDNKMYEGTFFFPSENAPAAFPYYDKLVSDLSEIYGNVKKVRRFKDPYTDGDGNEILALETGYADIFAQWVADKKTLEAAIISNHDKLYVRLMYIDDQLDELAKSKQKAKEKSDF